MTEPGLERPESHVLVLFGATGDLVRRKLLPGLYNLFCAGLMPERFRVIGASRPASAMTDEAFRRLALEAARAYALHSCRGERWRAFARSLSFAAADPARPSSLVQAVARAEEEMGGRPRRLYHLAVPPAAFADLVALLGRTGLAERGRVIVEKPFGVDLASAQALNRLLDEVFGEERVFRMDHFLGKESVENILALRFANGLFEPVWNRNHIDHVQIDVPETLSIEGRASFYEETGAFRDMVVTHLFQVLGFVAMEPPTALTAKALRDETSKVFEAMKPLDPERVVRGQYRGYRAEPGVAPSSETETFVALEVAVDNWRWAGVPFFLRTGKRLAVSAQLITLAFREPPLRMFQLAEAEPPHGRLNEVVIEFQDPGSISACFLAKEPGPTMRLREVAMTFSYERSFQARQLAGYERLIHDAMLGDQTLFTRADGIERLWRVAAPLLAHPPPLHEYEPGSFGPEAADRLIAPRRWRLAEPVAPVG